MSKERKSTAERAEEFAKDMQRTRGVPHWHDLRDAYLAGAESERAAEPTAGSEWEWPTDAQAVTWVKELVLKKGYMPTIQEIVVMLRERIARQPAPTQANNPEIPEGSKAGSERHVGPCVVNSSLPQTHSLYGKCLLCESQPAPTAQPDDRLELAIRALEFYANRDNYDPLGSVGDKYIGPWEPFDPDNGERARTALEQIAAKTKERK